MPDAFKTLFVVNPRSAGGKTAKIWPSLAAQIKTFVPDHAVKMTESPGHATELARAGLQYGYEMIVSVGGDGTNNEVINGFFARDGAPVKKDAVFACVPRGTGCDFARGLGIPKDPVAALRTLTGRRTTPLDAGRIECLSHDGKPVTRYFVNIAGFGANGDVVARVNRSGKHFGGFVTFLTATVASLAGYKNKRVALSIDGGKEEETTLNCLFVNNGTHCGGGMMTGPGALTDDGLFDLTIVGNFTKGEALASGRLLYSGKIYSHPKVRHVQAKKVSARPLDGEVLVEADGEQPGILPASYTIIPGAMRRKIA